MKRVFVTEYVGLSTRLEALANAFRISEHYGHEVCIDWHELDTLNIVGARRPKRGLLDRVDRLKLRRPPPRHRLPAGDRRSDAPGRPRRPPGLDVTP